MMGMGPSSPPPLAPDLAMLPPRTAMIQSLKTKVFQTLDWAMQCRSDEEALNAWRSMCAHGFSLVSLVVAEGALNDMDCELIDWKARVRLIFDKFDKLETHGKTKISRKPVGDTTVYGAQFDGFESEAEPQDLPYMLDSLNRDKYNRVCTNLMRFWGLCESVILATGAIGLNEQLETPISTARPYTERDIMSGIAERMATKPKKPEPPNSLRKATNGR